MPAFLLININKNLARDEIKKLIEKTLKDLYGKEVEVEVEQPQDSAFGDYATNIAMLLEKNPQEIVDNLSSAILNKIEVKNGFINLFLSKEYLQKQVEEILKQKNKFGQLKIGKGKRVNVEFISANPTGPLHVGNGRAGFFADVLSNTLNRAGYKATREYYINDMGRQIKFLENSLNNEEPSYKNEYIEELKERREKNVKKAVKYIIGKIQETAGKMGIKFDKWFYESELYPKETNEVLKLLKEKNLLDNKEGAVWFKSTEFGDDKDRVLVKSKEKTTHLEETYLLTDIAYLKNKFKRGFEYLIIFLGAEHHGYTARLLAAAEALGYDKNRVKPIIMQLVDLFEKGQRLKMSKRAGIYVTMNELLDEVGVDVARFFFLTKSPGSHLLFDLDLAKKQSENNPVYYVQYAHARICSILRKAKPLEANPQYLKLEHSAEFNLVKQLIRFPEIVEDTSRDYQVQRLPQYAMGLAGMFHQFYRDCRVISDDKEITKARLSLVLAAQIVLKNTLDLMGISAPEKM